MNKEVTFGNGRVGKGNHQKRDLVLREEPALSEEELEEMQEFVDAATLAKLKSRAA